MLHEQGDLQANDAITEIDQHDEPTEPMRRADVDAFIASPIDVPSPKSSTHPFPHQYVQQPLVIPKRPTYSPPTNVGSSYPVLPPRPTVQGGQRPAGSMPSQEEPLAAPKAGQNARRKFVPISVGVCFVAIQLLLLVRFVLKLVQSSPDNSWVVVLYDISNVFVLPFRLLFLQYSVPLFGTLEVYTLLAILFYGVVSRIVVRILKLLLKTR